MLIPPARKGNTQCRIIQLDSFSWGNKIYWNISIRFLFLNYKAFDLYIYIYAVYLWHVSYYDIQENVSKMMKCFIHSTFVIDISTSEFSNKGSSNNIQEKTFKNPSSFCILQISPTVSDKEFLRKKPFLAPLTLHGLNLIT